MCFDFLLSDFLYWLFDEKFLFYSKNTSMLDRHIFFIYYEITKSFVQKQVVCKVKFECYLRQSMVVIPNKTQKQLFHPGNKQL